MRREPYTLDFIFEGGKAVIPFDQLLGFLEECKEGAEQGVLFPEPYDELVKEQPGIVILTLNILSAYLSKIYLECAESYLSQQAQTSEEEETP